MDSSDYNPEKKGLQIAGLVVVLIGAIAFVGYIISNWFLHTFPTGELGWAILIGIVVVVLIGAILCEIAKKKKYGSKKIARLADVISWCFFIIVIVCLVLKFFVK